MWSKADADAEKADGTRETKIAVLADVREHREKLPVELWVDESGRIVVRAYDECGNRSTDVEWTFSLG